MRMCERHGAPIGQAGFCCLCEGVRLATVDKRGIKRRGSQNGTTPGRAQFQRLAAPKGTPVESPGQIRASAGMLDGDYSFDRLLHAPSSRDYEQGLAVTLAATVDPVFFE